MCSCRRSRNRRGHAVNSTTNDVGAAPTATSIKGAVQSIAVGSAGEIAARIASFDDGTIAGSYLAVRQVTPAITSKPAVVAATNTADRCLSLDRHTTFEIGCGLCAQIVITVAKNVAAEVLRDAGGNEVGTRADVRTTSFAAARRRE